MDTGAVKVKRIKVLDVPVDSIDPDVAGKVFEELLDNGQHNQIVFLSLRGLLRARNYPEFLRCLRDAALVLPISLAVVRGARFLGFPGVSLFNSFEGIIRILSVVEKTKGSVYMLGGRKDVLEVAEENLRARSTGCGSWQVLRVFSQA